MTKREGRTMPERGTRVEEGQSWKADGNGDFEQEGRMGPLL